MMKYFYVIAFLSCLVRVTSAQTCVSEVVPANLIHVGSLYIERTFKPDYCKQDGMESFGYRILLSSRDKEIFHFDQSDSTIACYFKQGEAEHRTVLLDTCYFVDATFPTSFNPKRFDRFVSFNSSYFTSGSFSSSQFIEDAYFGSIHVYEPENRIFDGALFKKNVDFDNAFFTESTYFSRVVFGGNTSFNNTHFGKKAGFINTTFNRVPSFINSELPELLEFADVTFDFEKITEINAKIDFSRTSVKDLRQQTNNLDAKCSIKLNGTDVSRLIIPFDRFSLRFDSTYSYEQKVSIYAIIIKNCHDAGLEESAEGWDIEYRKMQNIHNYWFLGFGYFANFFNWGWWNFGYSKWRILLIWLPLFFLCFWRYNYLHIERLWAKMYQDRELGSSIIDRSGNTPKPIFKNWKKRFSFSFFYTAVIYFGFKIRHEAVNYNYTRGLLYLYLMYAVGTIHMAFAFSYILSAY